MPTVPADKPKRTLFEKLEAWVSKLSGRSNFWHRICSLIWLPYAFHSGIRMKQLDPNRFAAVLPFRRFNKNWYNAMAGAALLGNAEIAGGMFVFGKAGADYTVVCKKLEYRFLRPCYGPAIYKIDPRDDLDALIAAGGEFNITLWMDVIESPELPIPKGKDIPPDEEDAEPVEPTDAQQLEDNQPKKKDKRVGKVVVTFHVTPKEHHKAKAARNAS